MHPGEALFLQALMPDRLKLKRGTSDGTDTSRGGAAYRERH